MKTSKLIIALLALAGASTLTFAQTEKSMIVEDGGTGKYKSVIVGDKSLPDFTIFRPQDLKAAATDAKVPVILYGNGGCQKTSVEIRYFMSELASHGYIAIAIGPYSEEDFFEHWERVMGGMHPKNKEVVLANGKVVPAKVREARPQGQGQQARQGQGQRPQGQGQQARQGQGQRPQGQGQQARQGQGQRPQGQGQANKSSNNSRSGAVLLDALDWLTAQNSNPESEYYNCIDLDHIAVMGQSCGGIQALSIADDPRVGTAVILNSGYGAGGMLGGTQEGLKKLHTPVLYLIGGPEDVAFKNANSDFEVIDNVPAVKINTVIDGHEGSYYEAHGGSYQIAVKKWLDWHFKGATQESEFFLMDSALNAIYPEWEIERKNF